MGNFFNCILVPASKTRLKSVIQSQMKTRGFRVNNSKPEFSFTISPSGKGWHTVQCELFVGDDFPDYASALSEALGTPALSLSCFDSDFIWLQLHKSGTFGEACIGTPYDDEPPSPSKAFWLDFVHDFDRFSEILSCEFVFAEETLIPLGRLIGFDGEALLSPNAASLSIGFSSIKPVEKPYVEDGCPRFALHGNLFGQNNPYQRNKNSAITFLNLGGPGTGMTIIAESPDLDREDVSLENASISHGVVNPDGSYHCNGNLASFNFSRYKLDDGSIQWRAVLPDFRIPKGLNTNWTGSTWNKTSMVESSCSIVFRYVLRTPVFLSSLRFTFIPHENPNGCYIWDIKDCRISPEMYEAICREPWRAGEILAKRNQSDPVTN